MQSKARPGPRHPWRTRGRGERGANLIEAAIITPLILLAIFTIVEFGAMLYVQMALQNGVGQATRFAITGNVLPGQNREASIRTVLQRETPTLSIPDGDVTFSHMPLGGTRWVSGTGPPNTIERVTVAYEWSIMTPLVRPFFSDHTIRFVAQSAMKNEVDIEL